jgi:hypothetical protein
MISRDLSRPFVLFEFDGYVSATIWPGDMGGECVFDRCFGTDKICW